MKWSQKRQQQIRAVFDANDLDEFKKLMVKYPLHLRREDGTDGWMWGAAIDGNLEMLKVLVSLGIDVNLSKDLPDPTNPFNTVEGPIVFAAAKGHTEVVRWLLKQGANINFEVNGKVRCLPLLDACARGYFEVVKLLVDHGSDLHFSFNGHTPLSQAEKFGHLEVADYLRSVGAKE